MTTLILRKIAPLTGLLIFSLNSLPMLAQTTTSVNADLSIDIPTLQNGSESYAAALIYAEPYWRLVRKESRETVVSVSTGLVEDSQLTLHCLMYLSDSYRTTFVEVDQGTEASLFEFTGAVLNPDCDDNSSLDQGLLPDTIPSYQLLDTAEVVHAVDEQLSGLSISDFFERSFAIIRARDPEDLIADGDFDDTDLAAAALTDISDAYFLQTVELQNRVLEKLRSYDRDALSEEEQLSYDIYLAYLESEQEWASYRDYQYPGSFGFFGWPGRTESFFTQIYTINNVKDAQLYLVLLNQTRRRFAQIFDLLIARRNAGVVEPGPTMGYSQSLVAALGNSDARATSYYQAFDRQLSALYDISEGAKEILRQQLLQVLEQQVLPAYRTLAGRMQGLVRIAPTAIGFGQYQGGEEFYNFTLRYFTSSDMDADAVHTLGQNELARIHNEMNTLFNQLGYPQSESLAEKFARVGRDAGIVAAADVKALYERIIDETYARLPASFRLIPEQKVTVVGGTSGGFYIRGSDDGTRPGAFYADTSSDQPYTTMPTLAYHEALPGHHLQIALANELNLPTFRRKYNNTAYIEGWALYAERLPKDLGWYEGDIYGDLGRLQFEAMRAARLVVDTGIHARGWTWEQADEYHIANVGFPGSIARYSVWPGQATAYMTGMLKILELRSRAETDLGNLYDIRDFHDAVIGKGAMPLQVLEQVVENYIAKKQEPSSN